MGVPLGGKVLNEQASMKWLRVHLIEMTLALLSNNNQLLNWSNTIILSYTVHVLYV